MIKVFSHNNCSTVKVLQILCINSSSTEIAMKHCSWFLIINRRMAYLFLVIIAVNKFRPESSDQLVPFGQLRLLNSRLMIVIMLTVQWAYIGRRWSAISHIWHDDDPTQYCDWWWSMIAYSFNCCIVNTFVHSVDLRSAKLADTRRTFYTITMSLDKQSSQSLFNIY